MTDDQILALIKEAHNFAAPEQVEVRELIVRDASLSELGIDSVSAMEMAGFIEERLGVEFPDDDMAALGNMSELIALIKKFGPNKRGEQSHAVETR